jgi:hypothetical protein
MFRSCSRVRVVKCAKIITALLNNIKYVRLKVQRVLHKDYLLSNKFSKKIIIIVKVNQMFKNRYWNLNIIITI